MRENKNVPSTISVMLDLEGTCDFINDEKAKLFINQLDEIRKQFRADYCTICISTHYDDSSDMKEVLDIFSRNLEDGIKIGINFFYGGKYDYENDCEIDEDYRFNHNKVDTFTEYYVNNRSVNNKWFVLIDDGIYEETYKRFQDKHPMLVCRPSQRNIDSNNINFMSLATKTKGFDGVIELLGKYMVSIESLSIDEVFDKQVTMIRHLSSYELTRKIRSHEYEFLIRYFSEGYADEADYKDALTWLGFQEFANEELDSLKRLLLLLNDEFEKNKHQDLIDGVKVFEKYFNKN